MRTETPAQHRPPHRRRWLRLVVVAAIASLAAVVLAACGSSGSSTSSTATNAASSSPSGSSGSRASHFASIRSCLAKEGITLPSAPSGGQAGGTNEPPGAGAGRFKLPEGVSQTKFREALKKCGAGGGFGRRHAFNSATATAAFTKYAACMRENGVNLPIPDTSGKGPVFDTKGIDTSSTTFKNAEQKCRSDLRGAFGAGARPSAGGEGAPPSGGEGGPAGGAPGGGPEGPPAGSEGGSGA